MAKTPEELYFQESPVIELGSNKFINVPIVLQYGSEVLIEVTKEAAARYTTKFRINSKSGELLATVKGTQMYKEEAGTRANLTLRHPDKMTICELDGEELFRVEREGPAALKLSAKLYTKDGVFIRANDEGIAAWQLGPGEPVPFKVGNVIVLIADLTVRDARIGIHYEPGKSLSVGMGGTITQDWKPRTEPLDFRGMQSASVYHRLDTEREKHGFEIFHDPDPVRRALTTSMYSKVRAISDQLQSEYGPFEIFALREMGLPPSRELIVSATWCNLKDLGQLKDIIHKLEDQLTPDERKLIHQILPANLGEPTLLPGVAARPGILLGRPAGEPIVLRELNQTMLGTRAFTVFAFTPPE